MRSLANMIDQVGKDFDFYVLTTDRDSGEKQPYGSVRPDCWQPCGNASVYYFSPASFTLKSLYKVIRDTEYDILYLNSAFTVKFTINALLLQLFRFLPEKPLIVAPRGEFSPGALAIKPLKKKIFLLVAKAIGLYRNVTWQASSESERQDIERTFGDVSVFVASDIRTAAKCRDNVKDKREGVLRLVFLSRICPIKNLLGALDALKNIDGQVDFAIYGPQEDMQYWQRCEKAIAALPSNIIVSYKGQLAHAEVIETLAEYHVFILPSFGENFGHVIHEALLAGCPIIISDRTPWRALKDKRAGWDIPVNDTAAFSAAISHFIAMEQSDYNEWSKSANELGVHYSNDSRVLEQNRELFYAAINRNTSLRGEGRSR